MSYLAQIRQTLDARRRTVIFFAAAIPLLAATFKGQTWFDWAAGVPQGDQLLLLGTCAGDSLSVERAISQGASANARNDFGCTPLMWAASSGDEQIARRLIAAGADVSVVSDPGLTALSMAAIAGRVSIIKLLLAAGAPIDQRGVLRSTALHWAVGSCHADVVDVLLASGADVNARDQQGRTPLLMAAYCQDAAIPIVRRLLAAGADVNATDDRGATALNIALAEEQPELCAVLMAAGSRAERQGDSQAGHCRH